MKEWNQMSNQEQVYMWWEYNAANPDDEISFSLFNEMMQGFTLE